MVLYLLLGCKNQTGRYILYMRRLIHAGLQTLMACHRFRSVEKNSATLPSEAADDKLELGQVGNLRNLYSASLSFSLILLIRYLLKQNRTFQMPLFHPRGWDLTQRHAPCLSTLNNQRKRRTQSVRFTCAQSSETWPRRRNCVFCWCALSLFLAEGAQQRRTISVSIDRLWSQLAQ